MTLPNPDGPLVDGFDDLLASNVVIVTGKGGVGKTTAAAALALCGAGSGRRTLLVEVEGRPSISSAFATPPFDYREREFRPGLLGVAIDPTDAVHEYLALFYGLRGMGWLMQRSHALDFVTTAAPGLRDLLLVGKVYELEARRRADGRRQYDLIIVDAPPTGRIVPFLSAPEAATDIVRAGPVRRQAGQIADMLHDARRTRAVLVTLPEETPVRETVEAAGALDAAGIARGPVIVNQVAAPPLTASLLADLDQLGAAGLRTRAADAGARMSGRTAELALALAREHAERRAAQSLLVMDLAREVGGHVLGLPTATGAGSADLEILADVLALQVGEDPSYGSEPAEATLAALRITTGGAG